MMEEGRTPKIVDVARLAGVFDRNRQPHPQQA